MDPAAKPFGKYTLARAKLIKNGEYKITEFIPRIDETAAIRRLSILTSFGSATEIKEKFPKFTMPPIRWLVSCMPKAEFSGSKAAKFYFEFFVQKTLSLP